MEFREGEFVECTNNDIIDGKYTVGKKYRLKDIQKGYSPTDGEDVPEEPNYCNIIDDSEKEVFLIRRTIEKYFR